MSPLYLAAFLGTVAAASPFDVTDFFGGFTLQDIGQTVGLGALALLFATDRILTRGQHERRVADIVEGHAKLLEARAERIAELTTSRDYYRDATRLEGERASRLAAKLADLATEASRTATATMETLEEAAREVAPDARP